MDRPSVDDTVRGDSLVPLYEGAPGLVSRSPGLYELLTLVVAVRVFFTAPAVSEVRVTQDADVICEVTGRVEYH